MLISYKWLETFFKKPLPAPEKLAELLGAHIFEVESLESVQNDFVLDVKVLPDRAPYALSHEAIAKEIKAILNDEFLPREKDYSEFLKDEIEINPIIEDRAFCDRYLFAEVLNLEEKDTPNWIKEKLVAVGQKSINPVVDILNFVMLDIGQPLHAFDASKVKGGIVVRKAKSGEKIITLDNKEIELNESVNVIADDEGVLAIAGIKGGKKAEVTKYTKHIFIESAHFNGETVRTSSQKVKIKNDSSKRFENNVSPIKAKEGILYCLSVLKKENPDIIIKNLFDSNSILEQKKSLTVSMNFIRSALGVDITNEDIVSCLRRIDFIVEPLVDEIKILVPSERLDIVIPEDIVDEVGRIYGYEHIEGILPKVTSEYKPLKSISVSNSIRNFLTQNGYSEIYTYALVQTGEVKIENPLADDKGFMRTNLSDAMEEKLEFNAHNADLLGLNKIKIFEIGKVFKKDSEETHLVIGVCHKNVKKGEKPEDDIQNIKGELLKYLNISENDIKIFKEKNGVLEIGLDSVFESTKEAPDVDVFYSKEDRKYKPISVFPFSSRDIAVFVPGEKGKENEVLDVIKKYAGDLLVRADLFDVFTKQIKETGETKTSYGYRLVFQSQSKTLTEKEINESMDRITGAMNQNSGWEVR